MISKSVLHWYVKYVVCVSCGGSYFTVKTYSELLSNNLDFCEEIDQSVNIQTVKCYNSAQGYIDGIKYLCVF